MELVINLKILYIFNYRDSGTLAVSVIIFEMLQLFFSVVCKCNHQSWTRAVKVKLKLKSRDVSNDFNCFCQIPWLFNCYYLLLLPAQFQLFSSF